MYKTTMNLFNKKIVFTRKKKRIDFQIITVFGTIFDIYKVNYIGLNYIYRSFLLYYLL